MRPDLEVAFLAGALDAKGSFQCTGGAGTGYTYVCISFASTNPKLPERLLRAFGGRLNKKRPTTCRGLWFHQWSVSTIDGVKQVLAAVGDMLEAKAAHVRILREWVACGGGGNGQGGRRTKLTPEQRERRIQLAVEIRALNILVFRKVHAGNRKRLRDPFPRSRA